MPLRPPFYLEEVRGAGPLTGFPWENADRQGRPAHQTCASRAIFALAKRPASVYH